MMTLSLSAAADKDFCIYSIDHLIQCSDSLRVKLVTARNSTSCLSLNLFAVFNNSFFLKLFIENLEVEEPCLKRKHPKIDLTRRRKIAPAAGEWKWETIALIP